MYKYIYKGHDQVSFALQLHKDKNTLDEIGLYQLGRWVSPPEAAWRIYRFLLNEINPSVMALPFHLKNTQLVTFNNSSTLDNVIHMRHAKKTMLIEYYAMNDKSPEARNLLYQQFPEQFVWYSTDQIWNARKRGFVIGRIVTVNLSEGDRYFLRLILNHVRGATCQEDLKVVDGYHHNTLREAALALRLLEADNSLQCCLREAASYQMPSSMRRLFTTILIYSNPANTFALWEEFQQDMIENYTATLSNTHVIATAKALTDNAQHLQTMGKKKDYNLPFLAFQDNNSK